MPNALSMRKINGSRRPFEHERACKMHKKIKFFLKNDRPWINAHIHAIREFLKDEQYKSFGFFKRVF